MVCPVCKSGNTKKYSVVYKGGTVGSSSEASVEVGGKSHSVDSYSTSQTLLASKCSPPEEKGGCIGAILLVIIFFLAVPTGAIGLEIALRFTKLSEMQRLLAGIGIGAVIFVFSFWLLKQVANLVYFNRCERKYKEEYAKWDKKWLCLKCEHTFDYPAD